jgi:hypothetical protein
VEFGHPVFAMQFAKELMDDVLVKSPDQDQLFNGA